MPDIPKWAAVAILLVGLGIMIGCAVPMSQTKESDKATSRYRGLIAGVVIGTLLAVGGLVMLVFGGGGGAAIPAPAGKEANLPSEKAGSAAVALSNSPLNNLKKLSDQTETQALLNENKARKLMEHAEEASDQVEKLRSVFRMFGKK